MVTESQVRDYLDVLFVERGNSPATIAAYRRDLAQYLEFLDGRHPDSELVSEFMSVLSERGLARSTIALRSACSIRASGGMSFSNPGEAARAMSGPSSTCSSPRGSV